MTQESALKPLGPYFRGQIVGYADRRCEQSQMMCVAFGSWFIVVTEPRQEELAKGEISERGLVTYLPMVIEARPHGRGQIRWCERKMFPSYLFVCCEATSEHWGRITNSRGVQRLLGTGGHPIEVHQGEIECVRYQEAMEAKRAAAELAYREAEDAKKVAAERRAQGIKSGITWDFTPEQIVRIKTGPFAGFNAQLEAAVDERDRVRALIGIFGRRSPTMLSAFDIEPL